MARTKLRVTDTTPRTKPGAEAPMKRRQIDPKLMESARRAAGGNTRRLHFHDDGSVIVLNFEGQECPECARVAREQAAAQKPAKRPARKASAKKS